MALELENLDETTRKLMIEEVELDISTAHLYLSRRLTEVGQQKYPELLKQAIMTGDDAWLADSLRYNGILKTAEKRRRPRGGYNTVNVPVNAAETLSEGEFNRFYCRAVCRRAIEAGIQNVEIYQAKPVSTPRRGAEERLGTKIDAQALLNDLRQNIGVEPALGLPPGPNSGLSVRLSETEN
jgi:hypothetical protein